MKWLNQHILGVVKSCIQGVRSAPAGGRVVLSSSWANVCGPGGWNAPHAHYPNHWSGVFYVDVEDSIDYEDENEHGGEIEFLCPFNPSLSFGVVGNVTYAPRNGQIIVFPSALQHLVNPHFNDFERITVAFNTLVMGPDSRQTAGTAEPAPPADQTQH